jgi:hypothetical protein
MIGKTAAAASFILSTAYAVETSNGGWDYK